ncbi:hypothetical protein BSL78_06140 [Apostichopus japonicus]|uniref:G-protein coupled receptors family 1 profile domain-containing protein n=1 Tax=Stichopus japonicus TaxID=307972 RepID=A0A2G8L9K8_STIJA|nr:hypothetical protein BSL78_06140 [Apostichopus japonicus]
MDAGLPPVHQTTTDVLPTSVTTTPAWVGLDCPNERQIRTLGLIQMVCAGISLLGALSMILYLTFKRICANTEVRPLFHLSCADAGLAIFLILSSTYWKRSDLAKSCVYFQILAEMFYLITFLLTANYALNVYIRMKDRYHRANKLIQLREQRHVIISIRVAYCFSWIFPVFCVIPALITTIMMDKDSCYPCFSLFFRGPVNKNVTGQGFIQVLGSKGAVFFMATLLSSLLAIIILYSLTTKVYKHLLRQQSEYTDRQRSSVRELQKRVTLYIGVFLFCWTPAFVLAIIEITNRSPCAQQNLYFLYIIQSVTAPSQGILNTLVYGWTRRAYYSSKESTPLNRQTVRGYGSSTTKRIYPQKPEPNKQPTEETTLFDNQA